MKTLYKAWKAFIHNKKYVIVTVMLEILFLMSAIQVHLYYFKPTADLALKIGEEMSKIIGAIPESELPNFDTKLMENEVFLQAYHELLRYITFFLLTMLAIWILFKTFIWYYTHKTIYKKMPLQTHALKFALLSIFWFIIMITALILYTITGIMSTTSTIIIIAVYLAIIYFSQISFALIPAQQTFKKTFILGIKHARTILPAFIINVILTAITIYLPTIWLKTMPVLSAAIIILITLPTLAFARLHIIIATWNK